MFNNAKLWYPGTDRKVSVESPNFSLCWLCVQVHILTADGVCLAKWLELQHVLRDLFLSFLQSQSAPLRLLKGQDIYVSFNYF